MAITGIYSYLPTADEFVDHWQRVNAAQPQAPIVLPNGTTLADFKAMENALTLSFIDVTNAATSERVNRAQLDLDRSHLQPRFTQFNQTVRLYLGATRFGKVTVKVPGLSAGEQVYKSAGVEVSSSWKEINAATDLAPFVPPLALPNFPPATEPTYSLENFNAELAALALDFNSDGDAAQGAAQARADRNAQLPVIKEAMKQYRATCELMLAPDSALLKTLPRLTPAALSVRGEWQAAVAAALLQWEMAETKNIKKLQVRGCLGDKYKADNEEIVADLPAEALMWSGNWGLSAPDAVASFKVYVMTTTGNEKGSNAVTIARPAR